MPSFRTILAVAAAALVAVVRADYVIDPSTVPRGTRLNWCQQELATCPLICEQVPPGGTLINSCDADSLTYGCVCANGLQPNISEYSLTLPYFTCVEWGTQCVAACGSDSSCASSCRQDHQCGALNPTRINSTTSSAMPATKAATTSNQVFTGLAGGSGGSGGSGGGGIPGAAAPPLGVGAAYTMLAVLGSLFLGFAVML